MAHEYTVTTPRGDVHLTTEHHHSKFRTIEDFLTHHKPVIDEAVDLGNLAVNALGVYLSHGRRGPKLK